MGAGFCQIENPRALLFQVARNALADQARLTKPQVVFDEQVIASPDTTRPPVDELDSCLLRNISEMSPDDREIIEQCDLQGASSKSLLTTVA